MKETMTPEQISFAISKASTGLTMAEIAALVNETFGTDYNRERIRGAFRRRGIYNKLDKAARSRANCAKTKSNLVFTPELYEYIKTIAPGRSRKEITRMVNEKGIACKESQVVAFMKRNGIKNGLDGRIPPGGDWRSELAKKAPHNVPHTCFKKGQMPKNMLPIGSEIVNADGYIMVKISDEYLGRQRDNWKFKHRLVWEQAHGSIPDDSIVIFLDNNKQNCNPENLALIPKGIHSIMNLKKLRKDDPELTKVGVNIAKLYKKIGERKL